MRPNTPWPRTVSPSSRKPTTSSPTWRSPRMACSSACTTTRSSGRRTSRRCFPIDRSRAKCRAAARHKRWLANDFTLAEIRRLDAGTWFDPKFAGERVPTFEEMIALVRGKGGHLSGAEVAAALHGARRRHGRRFSSRSSSGTARHARVAQSHADDHPVVRRGHDPPRRRELPAIPRLFLTEKDEDVTEARIREVATFATGIAPDKARDRPAPGDGETRARRQTDRHIMDIPCARADDVPVRARRDGALPLHARHRRAVHRTTPISFRDASERQAAFRCGRSACTAWSRRCHVLHASFHPTHVVAW